MLKSIEIFNFQSHEHTFVEFAEGINIISGSSDSGKSALMRSIRWVARNQPNGLGVVSWWAFRKSRQTEDTRVILTLTDGHTVERVRGTINGYIIDGDKEHPLEAVGTGVPDKVRDMLNLSDVNIQRQLDSPFLLADGAGDVARFFNKLIDMDEADKYQGAIEARRRKLGSDIASVLAQIEAVDREAGNFEWLDKASAVIARYERLEAENDAILAKYTALGDTVREFDTHVAVLSSLGDPAKAEGLCEKIRRVIREQTSLREKEADVWGSMREYDSQQQAIAVDTDAMESRAKKITRLLGEQTVLRDKEKVLGQQVVSVITAERDANAADRELFPLEQELALIDICPLCGHTMKEAPSF